MSSKKASRWLPSETYVIVTTCGTGTRNGGNKIRHQKNRTVKGSAGYYADRILWWEFVSVYEVLFQICNVAKVEPTKWTVSLVRLSLYKVCVSILVITHALAFVDQLSIPDGILLLLFCTLSLLVHVFKNPFFAKKNPFFKRYRRWQQKNHTAICHVPFGLTMWFV